MLFGFLFHYLSCYGVGKTKTKSVDMREKSQRRTKRSPYLYHGVGLDFDSLYLYMLKITRDIVKEETCKNIKVEIFCLFSLLTF
jgi:hypothetical protein